MPDTSSEPAVDLLLWRHAEAFEAEPGQADLDRALTPKGERQAERMARWLKRHLADDARVLASPARRCQQTAQALGCAFTTIQALGPEGSGQGLIQASGWPEGSGMVLIVGHQPTLGLVAAKLLTGQAQAWSVKKGSVWWLRSRQRPGEAAVLLQAVQLPELL